MATFVELQDKYLGAIEAINQTQVKALEAGLRLEELIASPGRFISTVKSNP